MQVFECPKCGASFKVYGDEEFITCEYCDSQVRLDLPYNEKRGDVDVRLKQIEVEREFRLKALEKEEKEQKIRKKIRKISIISWLVLSGLVLLVCIVTMCSNESSRADFGMLMLLYAFFPIAIGGGLLVFKIIPDKQRERELLQEGGIRLPVIDGGYVGKNVNEVELIIRQAGFRNVQKVSLNDVILGIFQKPDIVESVIVGDKNLINGGKVFKPTVFITIKYHGR